MNGICQIDDFVNNQTASLRSLWYTCEDRQALLPDFVSDSRKEKNESIMSQLLEWVGNQLDHPAKSIDEKKALSDELVNRLKMTGMKLFDLEEEQVNCIQELGIAQSAKEIFDKAKEFDPFISFAEIYQASRNVWTSNYLQVLKGISVALTPSLFAYSMLYPVSDNYLDNPNICREEKIAYDQRFKSWLQGKETNPQNANERDVLDLVRLIEKQYPRQSFPQVYESLLAIHHAQDKSMRFPHSPLIPNMEDLVSLTIEKGGTSVLADGILINGTLPQDEMEIIFNYGAFAQLMDDQEDIADDFSERAPTLFSEAARHGKVDQLMNRVFNFAHQVLKGLDKYNHPKAEQLKKISMKGIDLLLIDTALRSEKFYSRQYLKKLEESYPFRFDYVLKVRRMMKKRGITNQKLAGLLFEDIKPVPFRLVNPVSIFIAESRLAVRQ